MYDPYYNELIIKMALNDEKITGILLFLIVHRKEGNIIVQMR